MKWIILALIVWLAWRATRQASREQHGPAAQRNAQQGAERMVRCAHCGLNVPQAEALRMQDDYFCSAPHRDAGARHGGGH